MKAIEWLKSTVGAKLDEASYPLLAMLIENGRLSSLGDIRDAFSDRILEEEVR